MRISDWSSDVCSSDLHISALADRYVKDPREVVKAGDIVKVKVLEVDVARKRIALTRRLDDAPGEGRPGEGKPRDERGANRRGSGERRPRRDNRPPKPASPPPDTALPAPFAKARPDTSVGAAQPRGAPAPGAPHAAHPNRKSRDERKNG